MLGKGYKVFKRTLLFALLTLLIAAPAAAKGEASPLPLLLTVRHVRSSFPGETIVSSVNLNNGVVKDLFSVDTPYTDFSLSPTGDRVAYYAEPHQKEEPSYTSPDLAYYLWDVGAEKSRRVAINGYKLRDATRGFVPVWSPDGTRIAVVTNDLQGGNAQIRIIDAATGATLHILTADPPPLYTPVWSPDGSALAYQAEYCGRCARGTPYVVSATHDAAARPILPQESKQVTTDTLIGWLPDSREIIVSSQTDELLPHPADIVSRWLRINVETGDIQTIPLTRIPRGCVWLALISPATATLMANSESGYRPQTIDLPTGKVTFPP